MGVFINVLKHYQSISCSGTKLIDFLQGQLTCDMRELAAENTYRYAACCDQRGRVVANFWVVNIDQTIQLILPENMVDIVLTHLNKYAVFSKVVFQENVGLFIAELHTSEKPTNGIAIALPNSNRFLFVAQRNPFASIEKQENEIAWRKNNIVDHVAIITPETSLLFTPQMIEWDKLGGVSFTKGCYLGQEIIARTHYLGKVKRHLIHARVTQSYQSGDEIEIENMHGIVVDCTENIVLAVVGN